MVNWLRVLVLLTLAASASAQTGTVRVRGVLLAVSDQSLTVKANSGETVELALPSALVVQEVFPVARSEIKAGSFIGTAALPQPDGTRRAIAVMVFPESSRGTGEGHRPYDLRPGSTMTNATVADLVVAPQGRTLVLRYKDGEKTLVVPEGTPLITYKPADRSLLKVGARVLVTAEERNGTPTAVRVLAGRDGFVPPM